MINVKLAAVILSTLLVAGNSAQAGTPFMNKNLEKGLVNICKALKSDSKHKVRKAIKNSGLSKGGVMNGLVCNDMDPLTFALSHNANESAKYLAGKSGGQLVASTPEQLDSTIK